MGLADMGILDDILSALDRIPVWKRLQELPAKIDVPKSTSHGTKGEASSLSDWGSISMCQRSLLRIERSSC